MNRRILHNEGLKSRLWYVGNLTCVGETLSRIHTKFCQETATKQSLGRLRRQELKKKKKIDLKDPN